MTEAPHDTQIWAGCPKCGHRWIVVYLPMELAIAAATMQSARCPRCGWDRPFLARPKAEAAAS